MPRQIVRVGGGAGIARAEVDRTDRLAFGVRVAHAGPQRRAVAENRADPGVDRGLLEGVVLGQDILEGAFGTAIRHAELIVETPLRAAEDAGVASPGVEAAAFERP